MAHCLQAASEATQFQLEKCKKLERRVKGSLQPLCRASCLPLCISARALLLPAHWPYHGTRLYTSAATTVCCKGRTSLPAASSVAFHMCLHVGNEACSSNGPGISQH